MFEFVVIVDDPSQYILAASVHFQQMVQRIRLIILLLVMCAFCSTKMMKFYITVPASIEPGIVTAFSDQLVNDVNRGWGNVCTFSISSLDSRASAINTKTYSLMPLPLFFLLQKCIFLLFPVLRNL